jgi:hypothetical protein
VTRRCGESALLKEASSSTTGAFRTGPICSSTHLPCASTDALALQRKGEGTEDSRTWIP